jgi:uncharacterized protein (TIGR02145 family)
MNSNHFYVSTSLKLFIFLNILLFFVGCQKNSESDDLNLQTNTPSVNEEYEAIQIGNQFWMAENFKNTLSADSALIDGIYAYEDNENNVFQYGRLYTFEAAINACPDGWHLPSNTEWNTLISFLGSNAGDKLKEGGSSGFNAKMGGRLSGDEFGYIRMLGLYWTSTETGDGDHAMQKLIISNESDVITDNTLMDCALSVRYIKN